MVGGKSHPKEPTVSSDDVPVTVEVHDEESLSKKVVKTKIVIQPHAVMVPILNIRSTPSIDGEVVGQLTYGTSLPMAITGEWAKIGDGKYVHTKFLKPIRAKQPEVANRR